MPPRSLRPILLPAAALALYAWAGVASTFVRPGAIGIDYLGPGTDWMVLRGALERVLDGASATLWDGAAFTRFLNARFAGWLSAPLEYRPWIYPPGLLVVLLPFAPLGFLGSYLAFQAASAALFGVALRRAGAAGWAVAAVLLCPAAAINVVSGQLAFLVGGLMLFGLELLERRAFCAGLVFGLLSVKPQFALLLPVALLAGGRWRAIAGAAVSAIGLAALSVALFGGQIWLDWAEAARAAADPASLWTQAGRMWGNSVFACAALLGVPLRLADLLQDAAALAAAGCVAWAFRPGADRAGRAPVLLAAALLAAPHTATYDLVLLLVAVLLWAVPIREAGARVRLTLLAVWIAPLLCPPAQIAPGRAVPLLVALVLAFALTGRRAAARD